MTQRSYNQYCPISRALDVVGDRWSLLIVRDLLLGPKRFSDLRDGLPGIGTNILTDRLKGLEQANIIKRRVLLPPAASTVYELTPYGHQLEAPLQALAAWGSQSLGELQPDQVISRDSVMLTVQALFRLLRPASATIYQVEVVDARFSEQITVQIVEDRVDVTRGSSADAAVVVELDVATVFVLARGTMTLQAAVSRGLVRLRGLQAQLDALLA